MEENKKGPLLWRGKKDLQLVGQHNMDAMKQKRGIMNMQVCRGRAMGREDRGEEEERIVHTKNV